MNQSKPKKESKSLNTNHQLTARRSRFIQGLILGIFITISPYLFYLYLAPPAGAQVWKLWFITIEAHEFYDVSAFLHALITKISLVFFSSLAFLKITSWWRWTLLIPVIMFLYQLFGVLNTNWIVFDEYSFWHSLYPIIPIVTLLIYSAIRLNNKIEKLDLLDMVDREIESVKKEVQHD